MAFQLMSRFSTIAMSRVSLYGTCSGEFSPMCTIVSSALMRPSYEKSLSNNPETSPIRMTGLTASEIISMLSWIVSRIGFSGSINGPARISASHPFLFTANPTGALTTQLS